MPAASRGLCYIKEGRVGVAGQGEGAKRSGGKGTEETRIRDRGTEFEDGGQRRETGQ